MERERLQVHLHWEIRKCEGSISLSAVERERLLVHLKWGIRSVKYALSNVNREAPGSLAVGDEDRVKEAWLCCFVDGGERGAPGSLEVGDKESVKEALSCCSVDCRKRVQVHLQWEMRRV